MCGINGMGRALYPSEVCRASSSGVLWCYIRHLGVKVHNVKSLALAAVGLAVAAASLSAQTGTGSMKLSGVNGASGCFGTSSTGPGECVYTSPYSGQFNIATGTAALLPPGGSPFGPPWDIFCVDFSHNAYIGASTTVNFTNLGTGLGSGTYTRSSDLKSYLEAAWLAQQIESGPVNRTAALEMNGAIWQIMTQIETGNASTLFYRQVGSSWYNDYNSVGIAYWADQASKNYGSVNASNWVVVTPTDFATNPNSSQEFITQVTPEPATLLLMGTGLIGMLLAAAVLRRPLA